MSANTKPTFQSSFIQHWYAQNWDLIRWEQELSMLRNIGITEIIIASIADTKSKYAVYFSELPGFTHSSIDMIQIALTAAGKFDMKVRIGLGFSDDWWTNSSCRSWLNEESQINKAIISEVAMKYGTCSSFCGWYIPHEFSPNMALSKKQQCNLNSFFRNIAAEIKTKLSKEIMISPFYHGFFKWFTPVRYWSSILVNVLRDTGIDIVALQDSIGARFNFMWQLPRIYYYTKQACHALNMKFYIDIETFTSTSSGFKPAEQDRIEKQLFIAKDYTEHLLAFSIDHYQNKNEPNQIQFYNNYYKYFTSRND